MIRWKVKKYIEENNLCNKSDRLIVGVSGGADSVALLRLLLQMGYHVEVAHCNFRLRGRESERDEQFVRDLCAQLKLTLHVRRFDTTAYAEAQKISLEMAARDLRYDWFGELLKERGAVAVAVAHHQEDNAETILLNLIRGTGITGLCGMKPRNGKVIRPLLQVSRDEIEDYLQHLKQNYVTDSTNLEDNCVRNKIRLHIIPEMQTINPSVVDTIVATSARLNDAKRLIDIQLEAAEKRCRLKLETSLTPLSSSVENKTDTREEENEQLEGCKINIHQLQFEASPGLLLYRVLSPYGFNSTQIDEIHASLTGEAGKLFESSRGWTLLKDRDFLIIRKNDPATPVVSSDKIHLVTLPLIPTSSIVKWHSLTLKFDVLDIKENFVIPHKKSFACLDADTLPADLYIRLWKQGDRFSPFGMRGTKLLSDYMTDCKFSLFQKEQQAVLVDKDDRIIWLIGERIDNRYKIGRHTKRIVLIELI